MKPCGVGLDLSNQNIARGNDSARSDMDKYQMIRLKINQDSRNRKGSEIKGILTDPSNKRVKHTRRVIFKGLSEFKLAEEEMIFMRNRKLYKRDRELVNAGGGTLHRFKKSLNRIQIK